ncbi:hypothetical protein KR026_011741 [Drosophila bipectinata]|nr:hypothetical protein KR026_011741 [Drosophila bipectinata]
MLVKHIVKQGLLVKNVGAMSRAAYHGGHHQHSTMNDLPVPAGDWKEQHSQQNSKYNAVLLTGILVLAGTIGFVSLLRQILSNCLLPYKSFFQVKSSGLIHFNYYAPKSLD